MSLNPAIPPPRWNVGNTFFHPAVDYLLVAGVASVPFVLIAAVDPAFNLPASLAMAMAILINYAHFSASTVRLYTRPGLARSIPGLAWAFPIAWIALTGLCLVYSDLLAKHFWNLYQTWSPYHYAAQTFGITMMYAGRSGVKLTGRSRWLLWGTCMLPFLWAFLVGSNAAGLAWFVDLTAVAADPTLGPLWRGAANVLAVATFAIPAWFFLTEGRQLPLIAVALVVVNGMWWILLSYEGAWAWAAISHGVQYLIVVGLVDVADHVPRGQPRFRRALVFYVLTVLVGLLLFHGVPALILMGTSLEAATVINVVWAGVILHHFIVDGFIWKRKRIGTPVAA